MQTKTLAIKQRHLPLSVFILLASLAAQTLTAQERGLVVLGAEQLGTQAQVGKQYALFIAIDAYTKWTPLKKPVADAREIRDILRQQYYIDEVIELYNATATRANIARTFTDLQGRLNTNDSLFIYYAGHGHLDAASKQGFWIPVNAGLDEYAQENWLANSQIRGYISQLKTIHVFMVSDACFSGDILNTNRARPTTIDNAYYRKAYSLVSRQVLTSGSSETVPDESEFSQALKMSLRKNNDPLLDPHTIHDDVRRSVQSTTPLLGTLNQASHQEGATFIFFRRPNQPASQIAQSTPQAAPRPTPQWGEEVIETGNLTVSTVTAGTLEIRRGSEVVGSRSISAGARLPVNNLAVGTYTVRITYSGGQREEKTVTVRKEGTVTAVFDYQPPVVAVTPPVSVPATPAPRPAATPPAAPRPAATTERPIPSDMVRIQGGTFMMGSPASEANRDSDEVQHRVTVSGFYLGKYEVTQKEYQALMGTNPSYFKGDNLPVECVTWYDAVNYCNARSRSEGLTPAYTVSGTNVTWNRSANGYRLPTEAEWEYACRAGTATPYSSGSSVDGAGWYGSSSGNKTHPVGTKQANAWGLYDMHGNVYEWCWDWFGDYGSGAQTDPMGASSGTNRVARGGSWVGNGQYLRSAYSGLQHSVG